MTIVVKAGDVFGRLTVIEEVEPMVSPAARRNRIIRCLCECGSETKTNLRSARRGEALSCGCLQREAAQRLGRGKWKHGMCHSTTYKVWGGILQRCTNPRDAAYIDYGGRGITVCERWLKFENFLEDMSERPSRKHSIDRIDNDKGYFKDNCRWATRKEQGRNRRSNRLLTFNGETMCLAEWAERTGLNRMAILSRLRRGRTIEEALA